MSKKKSTKQQKRKQQKAQRRKKRQVRRPVSPQYPSQERILSDWGDEIAKRDGFDDAQIVMNPAGETKLSDALLEITGEFAEMVETRREMHRLLFLASTAWNATLLPEDARKDMLRDVLNIMNLGDEELAGIGAMLAQMMVAKRELHPTDDRFVVDVQVVDQGDHFYISAASLMSPPE